MNKEELEASNQKIIDKYYGGDRAAYEAEFEAEMKQVLRWKDLANSTMIHPELEKVALTLVERFLGYTPPDRKYIGPDEEFLRKLIYDFRIGDIDAKVFLDEVEIHIKAIRNRQFEYLCRPSFQQNLVSEYETKLSELKGPARQRLIRVAGYEPHLEASRDAEIIMRMVIADKNVQLDDHTISPYDLIALSSLKYMEVLLAGGKQAADESPIAHDCFEIIDARPFLLG